VADDGRGFDVARRAGRFGPEGGYGLASAFAQVQAVGGRLALRSRPGRGTVARLWVPGHSGHDGDDGHRWPSVALVARGRP
jgi:signal transduction histidine kinase